MGLFEGAVQSLSKNKKWIAAAGVLYLIPVFYRLITKNSIVPVLDKTLFLYHSNSQTVPVNLETLGTLFVIPGALGAVVGANFLENIFNRRFAGLEKYLARVLGAFSFTLLWIAVHFIGYNFFNPVGPWGTHIWAAPSVYARNLLVAITLAPLVPYAVEFVYKRMKK